MTSSQPNVELRRDGSVVLARVHGTLLGPQGDALYRTLSGHIRRGREVRLSLGGVQEIDGIAAAGLAALIDLAGFSRGRMHVVDSSPAVDEQFGRLPAERTIPPAARPGLIVRMAAIADRWWGLLVDALVFQADALFGCALGLFSSKSRRRGAVWRDALSIGTDALPVVGTIAFLLGLILAFQFGHLLRDFGTSIYVANLVAKGMVREFAPLMTAIVVSGRSGAAIAAEIGAMKNNEELDALTVMGIEPVRYLVVPKLYAVTLTQPLLSVMASLISILGGFIIAVTYLRLGPEQYLNQTLDALVLGDVVNLLLKSIIFGWLVVLIGAFMGFNVARGAEGVGRAATRAVVVSIFAIIFADGIITTVDTLTG